MKTHGTILIGVLAALIGLVGPTAANSQPGRDKLYTVKKIYVGNELKEEVTPPRREWISDLRKELTRVGFVTVDDAADADAILDGENQGEIVLDGPQPDPPKYFFKYQLRFRNRETVWQTKFTIRSRLGPDEVNEQAANRIARILLTSWLKSARAAGLYVDYRRLE